jgi:thiamine-phosphate pyrophosphorylase
LNQKGARLGRQGFRKLAICYYITARAQLSSGAGGGGLEVALRQKVQAAFSAGVDYVQVREKDLPARRLAALVEDLASLTERKKARLLVNERLDIADSCGADGVHLPSGSVPLAALRRLGGESGAARFMIWGVSCHQEPEVARAAQDGASYVLLGPIFETPSKPGVKPLGLSVLEDVCRRYAIPVFALGGIDATNAPDCVLAGAAGVAGIRLFQQAPDLGELCHQLHALKNSDRRFHE